MRSLCLAALASIFALACSSGVTAQDAGADGGPSGDQACRDVATAQCNLRNSCTNGFAISTDYGDLATCISRTQTNCLTQLSAPGTGSSAAHSEGCAQALAGESCFNYFTNAPPAACAVPAGTLANGAACAFPAQCQSTFCAVGDDQICGTCQPQPVAGSSCDAGSCGSGLFCLPDSWTCTQGVPDGGACNDRSACGGGESCVGFLDGGSGVCTPRLGIGASCDARQETGPNCFNAGGADCVTTVGGGGTGRCAAITVAQAGEACGRVPHVSDSACGNGGLCVAAGDGGSCVAPVSDGQSCDSVAGPPCFLPAKCVPASDGGTAGTCTLPNASLCG
ncbi:MAG: hypothetical protein ACYDCL_02045 [Myxococcales bacterium]